MMLHSTAGPSPFAPFPTPRPPPPLSCSRGAAPTLLFRAPAVPSHRRRMAKSAGKKPKGGKAKKQRKGEHKKRIAAASGATGGDDGGKDLGLGPAAGGAGKGHQRNPRAFVFSGRGKAKRQAARSAEKDQRRMHGARFHPIRIGIP